MRQSEIRTRRQRTGLTQTALAGLVGVHNTTISSWEIGKVKPSGSQLDAIAKALGARDRRIQERRNAPRCFHCGDRVDLLPVVAGHVCELCNRDGRGQLKGE